jgi:hypothetical protein
MFNFQNAKGNSATSIFKIHQNIIHQLNYCMLPLLLIISFN